MLVRLAPFIGAFVYFLWAYFALGLRSDHIYLIILFLGLYHIHPKARRFLLAFLPFLLYWVVYDTLRIFQSNLLQPIHIGDLYEAEKSLFGIQTEHGRLTPNEYWLFHTNPVLDFLTGIAYINWFSVPLVLAGWFWVKDKQAFTRFSTTFFLANLIGWVIYYIYPAAPPWYYELYGNIECHGIEGCAAGLLNFDAMFNINLFKNMYSMAPNPFAAMPSLHSAFPITVLTWSFQKFRYMNILFVLHGIGIWFSAVYLSHHYTLDVLAGILCGLLSFIIVQKLIPQKWFSAWEAYL